MDNENAEGLTRRQAIVAGLAGAATLAALPTLGGDEARTDATAKGNDRAPTPASDRLPVVFLPHGGGPWPFVDVGMSKAEIDTFVAYLRSIRALPKTPPKALLVVSAHWENVVPAVMTAEHPPMFYDYYGFPPASYQITWPAPGDPQLAARVAELLGTAGFETATNATRGFDHGTFIPLKLTYPDADIPTVQLSLIHDLDPEKHIAMGRALAPLRDEGVLILGSGMTYHNMRGFRDPNARPIAETFDAWLRETMALDAAERDRRLIEWENAPGARLSHPREEHLLPLMVVAGAAGMDRAITAYNGSVWGIRISAYHFG